MTVLRSGSATDVGRVRSANEDLAFEGSKLFAVADGMGGHAGGEVAAKTAIDSLRDRFQDASSADGLVEAVHEANQAVWEKGHDDPSLRGMGTTLITAALVRTEAGDRLVLANVGDSRAYRLHGDDFAQVTVDHSVAEELVARGELSEREAAVHPHRHILTRALGVDPDVDVDVWELVPESDDRYLLCSDGLTNEIPPEEIHEILSATRDPREAADRLVHLANERGGNDNITAVVLDVLVGEPPSGDGSRQPLAGAMLPPETRHDIPPVTKDGTELATAQEPEPANLVGRAEEEPAADESLRTRQEPALQRTAPRRLTVRVVLFALVLGGLGYAGWAAVNWYVENSYFVGLHHGQVVVYQGRRDGFMGFAPKVVQSSGIRYAQLPSNLQATLTSGVEEPSRSAARGYVGNLHDVLCAESPPPAGVACSPPSPAPGTPPPPPAAPAPAAARASATLPDIGVHALGGGATGATLASADARGFGPEAVADVVGDAQPALAQVLASPAPQGASAQAPPPGSPQTPRPTTRATGPSTSADGQPPAAASPDTSTGKAA